MPSGLAARAPATLVLDLGCTEGPLERLGLTARSPGQLWEILHRRMAGSERDLAEGISLPPLSKGDSHPELAWMESPVEHLRGPGEVHLLSHGMPSVHRRLDGTPQLVGSGSPFGCPALNRADGAGELETQEASELQSGYTSGGPQRAALARIAAELAAQEASETEISCSQGSGQPEGRYTVESTSISSLPTHSALGRIHANLEALEDTPGPSQRSSGDAERRYMMGEPLPSITGVKGPHGTDAVEQRLVVARIAAELDAEEASASQSQFEDDSCSITSTARDADISNATSARPSSLAMGEERLWSTLGIPLVALVPTERTARRRRISTSLWHEGSGGVLSFEKEHLGLPELSCSGVPRTPGSPSLGQSVSLHVEGALRTLMVYPGAATDPWGGGVQSGGALRLPGRGAKWWSFDAMVQSGVCSDRDAVLLDLTVDLVQAAEEKNQAVMLERLQLLKEVASPKGRPVQRLIHYVLYGLLLRTAGLGYAAFSAPSTLPIKAAEDSRLWYGRHSCATSICSTAVRSAVLGVLAGKTCIHILELGYFMNWQWGLVLRLLAAAHKQRHQQQQQQKTSGQQQGWTTTSAGGVPVPQVRLSIIWLHRLINPDRSDLVQLNSKAEPLTRSLRGAAAAAGIHLELEVKDLTERNLPELALSVERRPEEELVVVGAMELDYLLDSAVVPFGIRDSILEWIGFLSPAAFCMVGIDMDANDLPLAERVVNLATHQVAVFASHDAVAKKTNGWDHLYVFEEAFIGRAMTNVVACEGAERMLRCQVHERWKKCMAAAGLVPGRLLGVDAAYEALQNLPDGASIHIEHGFLCATWRGFPLLAFSMWAPKNH